MCSNAFTHVLWKASTSVRTHMHFDSTKERFVSQALGSIPPHAGPMMIQTYQTCMKECHCANQDNPRTAYLVLLVGNEKKKRRCKQGKNPLLPIFAGTLNLPSMPSRKSTTSACMSRASIEETSSALPLRPRRHCCTIAFGVDPHIVSCFMMANARASGSLPSNLQLHHHHHLLHHHHGPGYHCCTIAMGMDPQRIHTVSRPRLAKLRACNPLPA